MAPTRFGVPHGRVAEWLKAADCKSARVSVHWFESSPFHHPPAGGSGLILSRLIRQPPGCGPAHQPVPCPLPRDIAGASLIARGKTHAATPALNCDDATAHDRERRKERPAIGQYQVPIFQHVKHPPNPARLYRAAICGKCERLRNQEGRLERVAGIEPAYSAWKAAALPLCYTRGPSRSQRTATTGRWRSSGSDQTRR